MFAPEMGLRQDFGLLLGGLFGGLTVNTLDPSTVLDLGSHRTGRNTAIGMLLGILFGGTIGILVEGIFRGFVFALAGLLVGGLTIRSFRTKTIPDDATHKFARNTILGMLVVRLSAVQSAIRSRTNCRCSACFSGRYLVG